MKRLTALLLLSVMTMSVLAGCTSKTTTDDSQGDQGASGDKPYIAVVSKGFQHPFWQVVNKGAQAAADEYGVSITFDGPPTESDINIQVDMLKSALTKNPAAISLAALDTNAVSEQLNEALSKNIPIIGFDSGVPNAPEGSVYATASTDNYAASEMAAEELYKSERFQASLKATTNPVIAVLSQDATSDSISSRTHGFIDKLRSLIEADMGAGTVEVKGHTSYAVKPTADTKATILLNIPATTSAADLKSGADTLLATKNVISIFASNEGAANGLLAATNDGADFAEGAKFGNIVAVGFDAGKAQKTAVENGWFLGSVTQDPYSIGYKAVMLAYQAINGEIKATNEIVDTGAKFYTKDNLSDPSINELVYE